MFLCAAAAATAVDATTAVDAVGSGTTALTITFICDESSTAGA